MSSPYNPSASSRKSRDSPSRLSFNNQRRPPMNGCHKDTDADIYSSPSRQLYEELARVHLDDEKKFKELLDEQNAEQKKRHQEALEAALREHEQVRHAAEVARQRVELQIEQERLRRAAEEQRKLEEDRKRVAEQEHLEKQRQLDNANREEAQRQEIARQDQALQAQKREVEARKQREAEEKRQKDEAAAKEAEDTRRRDAAAAGKAEAQRQQEAQQRQQQQQPNGVAKPAAAEPRPVLQTQADASSAQQRPSATQMNGQTPSNTAEPAIKGVVSSQGDRDALHKRYTDLGKRLTRFRKDFQKLKNGWDKNTKKQFDDWKHQLNIGISQTSKYDPVANRNAKDRVRNALLAAQNGMPHPQVDVSEFIVGQTIPPDIGDAKGPAILLYFLNLFVKRVVKQFCAESLDQERANPIGVLVVQIFSMEEFQLGGRIPLIDLLWAKYHIDCPILFGVWGPENTLRGKIRLGWQTEDEHQGHSQTVKEILDAGQMPEWESSQAHYDRLRGLANGFAAVTLRNFSKAKASNPAPNRIYWESLARITNVPQNEVTLSHFVVLKNMIDGHVPRFISIYGQAALVALRHALIDFPSRVMPPGQKNVPSQWTAVETLPMQLMKELKLAL